MEKKKQKTIYARAPAPSEGDLKLAPGDAVLKALIHSHSDFFDKLIELIPARFYLPPTDDASDNPKPYFHGLSKAGKASLKRQSIHNLKIARRNRLDPEKIPHSSTLDLLKQALESSNAGGEEGGKDSGFPGAIGLEENRNDRDGNGSDKGDEKTVTYEELQKKLRLKIESLRGNRGGGGGNVGNRKIKKGKVDNGNKGLKEKKRRRDDDGSSGKDANLGENEGEEIIEYGKVKIGDDEMEGRKTKKKKKMSKAKELDRARRLSELKMNNPTVVERESWRAAESRAMGMKVHDDPKLLKESMKKEKKRKEKNAEKWKERLQSQEKSKEERQLKRKENIEERKRDKKMRRIAKREKKLMRPGFEGRKNEYITKD